MKGKLAKKKLEHAGLAYLNAGASRRWTGNLRTRLGRGDPACYSAGDLSSSPPLIHAQIITVDGQRDRGAKNSLLLPVFAAEQEVIKARGTVFPHLARMNCAATTSQRVMYGAWSPLTGGVLRRWWCWSSRGLRAIAGYAGGRADLLMMCAVT